MRYVIKRFLRRICGKVEALAPARIVDLGCGEGLVAAELSGLPIEFEYIGIDLNAESIEAARQFNPNLRFVRDDIIAREPDEGWASVAICLEVLEHLNEPRDALKRIIAWTSQTAIVSVPWEPYFRIGNLLRCKNVTRLDGGPGHVQQFRPATLEILLREFAEDVRVETCFPWLIGTIRLRP
jgi:SAM-dependent methyltransferase